MNTRAVRLDDPELGGELASPQKCDKIANSRQERSGGKRSNGEALFAACAAEGRALVTLLIENERYPNPRALDARLAEADLWIDADAFQARDLFRASSRKV